MSYSHTYHASNRGLNLFLVIIQNFLFTFDSGTIITIIFKGDGYKITLEVKSKLNELFTFKTRL